MTHQERYTAKAKVLLCGTLYGQVYLDAIFEVTSLELAGIYANGSDRSIKLSEQWGIPLYTSLQEIDEATEEFDIACIAINENIGTELANAFMQRGLSVLMEHPINAEHMRSLLHNANKYNVQCQVNSHFSELPPAVQFIDRCHELNQESLPLYIHATCNTRTLFSLLDILKRCFGKLQVSGLSTLTHDIQNYGYTTATCTLTNLPCTFIYQNWRYQNDNSQDSPLGHHIVMTYPQGTLILSGTFGPTLWLPLLSSNTHALTPAYNQANTDNASPPRITDIIQWRKQANQNALKQLHVSINQSKEVPITPYQTPTHLQEVSELWQQLSASFGEHQILPTPSPVN